MGRRRRRRTQGGLSPRARLRGGANCGRRWREGGGRGSGRGAAAPEGNIGIRCDLVTGWCEIEYVSRNRDLPAARFRVAAAKLAPYATIGEGARYGERGEGPWMIYDGFYWSYILGTDDAVLLRGTSGFFREGRRSITSPLFRSIRRSARGVMRRLWGIRP